MSAKPKDVRLKVFVRDLTLDAVLGIHAREKQQAQPIRVNLELDVALPGPLADTYENTVCYHEAAKRIQAIVAEGHVNLVETWAERIAEDALNDPRVQGVRVRIEKLAAVPRTQSVGVEIERRRTDY